MSKRYRDLRVWQAAIELANLTYRLTGKFPPMETYGLSAQMRRCAVSIASNIAEGSLRNTKKDFIQFLAIAAGSLAELHTQSIIARDNTFIALPDFDAFEQKTDDVSRMLSGLKASLKQDYATQNA